MSNKIYGKIFDIKRFAVHDGKGIRTTVFLKGCPLKCVWCHNPEGISPRPTLAYTKEKCISCGECAAVCKANAHYMTKGGHELNLSACTLCGKCERVCLGGAIKLYGKNMTVDETAVIVLEDKCFYDVSGGGVTLSGGECLMQSEFCLEIMKVLKANGVSCCVDTSGCVPRENIEMVIDNTEMFLYDIKFIDENLHRKYTGKSNKIILDNLLYINKIGVPTEIRIPVIPTVNCGEAEKISEFLTDLRCITAVRLLRYNNLAGSKYLRCAMKNTMPNVAPPTDDEIKKFAEPFIKRKIKIII